MSAITDQTVSIVLTESGAKAVRSRHPWLYDSGIAKTSKEAEAGDIAVLYDSKRKFAGLGLYDPQSPIKVRILHTGRQAVLDKEFLKNLIYSSISKRGELINNDATTGFRLVAGENDRIPGIVLDVYDSTAVLKVDSCCWLKHLDILTELIIEAINPERIVLRMSRSVKEFSDISDGAVIYGEPLSGQVVFKENGILFYADPVNGQKTGFFIDQRNNRAETGKLSAGRSVLNVFAYTGGFSIYAAKGGASSVASLDISRPALDGCVDTFELNNETCPHEIICGDAFTEMDKLIDQKRKFGLVIVDPPSFARKQSDVHGALKAYRKLNASAVKLLEKNGILVAASCSARVTSDDFFDSVIKAVKASGRRFSEIKRTAHAEDHPVGFPEGAYLKCIFIKMD